MVESYVKKIDKYRDMEAIHLKTIADQQEEIEKLKDIIENGYFKPQIEKLMEEKVETIQRLEKIIKNAYEVTQIFPHDLPSKNCQLCKIELILLEGLKG